MTVAACLLYVSALTFLMPACKKNSDAPAGAPPSAPAQPAVVISSISPLTGPYSTVVTITGSGFSANAVDNIVKFNDSTAVVQSASATQLVVAVPKRAGTGAVSVQNASKSATGPAFTFVSTITVSTLAGSGLGGYLDGTGAGALFTEPVGIASDRQNNLYITDDLIYYLRKCTTTGTVSTIAGMGVLGFADGNGASAKLGYAYGAAVDGTGNVFITDVYNARIRKITAAGIVSTVAGSGTAGFADGSSGAAKFNEPYGIAADAQGNLYVADEGNNRIRKITPAGVVSTLAGNGSFGSIDGNGASATFSSPTGVTVDAQGNLYVADRLGNHIRKVTPNGDVSTVAGSGASGSADGNGTAAQFRLPAGITLASNGNLYVTDESNHSIRMITPAGVVSTIAGTGKKGFADGNGVAAQFSDPLGITSDAQGNLYVADFGYHRIRKITIE